MLEIVDIQVAVATRAARGLVGRIKLRIEALKTNPKSVSKRAGLGATAVSDILNGKSKKPSLAVIQSLASALECSVAYLVGEDEQPQHGVLKFGHVALIPIIGVAETGAFRRMNEFDEDDERSPKVQAQRSRAHPKAKHFALQIRGDSMNAAKPYPLIEGMVALCVDIVDAEIEIESGRIYAVRRTLDGGQTFECTVKRAKVYRNRYELHPESTNPIHKPLVIPRGAGAEDSVNEITAIGLVYGISFEGEI